MTYQIGSVQLTKWQLALIIGTPVCLGVGVYIYKKFNHPPSEDIKKPAIPEKDEICGIKDKTSLILDVPTEDKEIEKKKKNVGLSNDILSPLKMATMYKNEGNICYRNGKFDEAIAFYDKAISVCPEENPTDLAIFYQNRAAAYEMLKKWNSVKEDCTKSLQYNSRYAKAYFRRAKAHEALFDYSDCLDDVTATCILEMFQNNSTIMYADRILKMTGRHEAALHVRKPVLPSKSFIRTYMFSFASDPILKIAVPDGSENVRGFARARLALEQERYEDVISACTEEIESSESESQYKSEALLLRGTFQMLSGCFTEAQQDLEALINNSDVDVPLRVYALLKRASLYIQLEDKDKGLDDFEAAHNLMPQNPDVHHQRAQIYILLERLDEALDEFNKVIKYSPNHAMAYVQKCYAEYRLTLMSQDQMRLMKVINDFKYCVDKFPTCVECHSLMAQVLADQQQFQQADQFYEKAIKLSPDNASLYVHRAIMLLQWRGDATKAVAIMNEALEIDDKCELAYETLGTVEVQRANLTRALELFEKAIALAKSHSELAHLYALRNAAKSQINVTQKLGIDISTISAITQSGGGSVPVAD